MFPHRRISGNAKHAMQTFIDKIEKDHKEIVEKAKKEISKITKHKNVEFTSSGSSAIFIALKMVEGKVMIPDQGGWIGFKRIPKLFGIETCEIKTNLGIIEPESLENKIESENPKALLLTSFAGYIAEQDMKEISKICKKFGVIIIEDASGAIGDEKLANGRYSDIIVCSTGEPKILNLYSGGFISSNFDIPREFARLFKISPIVCAGIIEELKHAKQIIATLAEYSHMIKLRIDTSLHKDRRGLCVGFRTKNPKKVFYKLMNLGFKTDLGSSLFTICPNYNRFLEKGLVLELKKLDISKIKKEDIEGMGEIINEVREEFD